MAGHEPKYLDYAAAYVLDALDGENLREFKAHLLTGCSICPAEIMALTEAASLIPMSLHRPHISDELRDRIIFSVHVAQTVEGNKKEMNNNGNDTAAREQPPKQQASSLSGVSWVAVALIAVVIVIFGGYRAYLATHTAAITRQNQYVVDQRETIGRLAEDLARKQTILDILQSRSVSVATMKGIRHGSDGYGKIIWDPEGTTVIVQLSHLPSAPDDMNYQLWMAADRKKISMGVFATESLANEKNLFTIEPLVVWRTAVVDSFFVTLEPRGGSLQPTGETFLSGTAMAWYQEPGAQNERGGS